MGFKLSTGVMPKSNKGRKATPLDEEMLAALEEFLAKSAPVDEGEYFSPQYIGPDDRSFEKDHQAQAQGRKYAQALNKRLSKKVSVTVASVEREITVKGKKEKVERFVWRLYIPLSEFPHLREGNDGTVEEVENAA